MVATSSQNNTPTGASPFLVANDAGYQRWRKAKLADQPQQVEDLIVDIDSLTEVEPQKLQAIVRNCRRANMAIYRCSDTSVNSGQLRAFGQNFGLRRLDHHLCAEEDGISELTVAEADQRGVLKGEFIPYTSHRLGWHTDGYYNDADHRIQTILLHCAQPAAEGGENALMDPEIAYIMLRDENPEFITALMHPECMTIPAFETDDDSGERLSRPTRSGRVFGIDPSSGALFMRYTARSRNIVWRDDPLTDQAIAYLSALLASDNAAIFRVRLEAGQGLICNNVLHNRTAFVDDPKQKRLVYRARYFDPIALTS